MTLGKENFQIKALNKSLKLLLNFYFYIYIRSPVSEWCDDEPSRIADVLVCVNRVGVRLFDVAVLALAIPVELQLREPFEGSYVHTA